MKRSQERNIKNLLNEKIFFFIFFLISSFIFCQNKKITEIDKLLTLSGQNSGRNNLKALEYAKQASLIAEQMGTSQKKAKSYTTIARVLSDMAITDQSFEYLDKAVNETYTSTDIMLAVYIKEIRCLNYTSLNMMQNVRDEYMKILQLLKNSDNKEANIMKFRAYANIASYYYETKNYPDAVKYIKLAENLAQEANISAFLINELAATYAIKGYVYLDTKQPDLAYHYFQKSFSQLEKYDIAKYTQFMAFADYYLEKKEYKLAIEYYLKTLQDMQDHHIEDKEYRMDAYKRISSCYDSLNDNYNKQAFLQKYYEVTEETFNDNSIFAQAAINNILNETESTRIKDKKKHDQNFYLISALCLIVLSATTYYYLNRVKITNNIINHKENEIETNKIIISEKENETTLLRKQLNESFEDLVELAKTNNSEFLARFQDVYPDFTEKLLKINPSLATSELQFCAFLTFNFTSKEIAQFTYISPRTVENKKTRIRKRLNIPLDKNINVWLRELLQ